ncbi:MAG: AMP-binding protein [Mogibacterium sp.]|nr:AMP-binding protein [Mogibacterium sp.]
MSKNLQVKQLKPVYPSEEHENVPALLDYAADEYGDSTAFILKDKSAGRKGEPVYRNNSYRDLRDDVCRLGTGLMASGIRNARIAIIGENSYHWQLSYLAAMSGLGICVPLDKGLPYTELKTSIQKSGSSVLIFDKKHASLADRLRAEAADPMAAPTAVSTYVCMDEGTDYLSIRELLDKGEEELRAGNKEFKNLRVDREALSNLIFTSGTTSAAKAVMLCQRNIMFNVFSLKQVEDIRHGEVNIALLPYHHTFGATGQLLMYACGATTVFCDGLKYLQKNFVEYHVSVFIGVPLLMEAMYKKIMAGIRKKGKEKTFERGVKLARMLRKAKIDVRRRLFKDVIDELGGSLRMVVSGASALDAAVINGYQDIGIEVVQGYGMTESAPVIAGENLFNRAPGSIGLGFPGMDVEIADPDEEGIGEIIVRSPSVMMGYYQDKDETDKVLKDGWLHTGDLAYLDSKGCIHITGRSKNVIVLKNGKNVYPEEIETIIAELPYVEENIVFGEVRREGADDRDEVLVAKIVYDKDLMKEKYGAETEEQIYAIVDADIDRINSNMPKYKHVHRLILQTEEMAKTTTGKVKRYEENK